MTDDEINAEVKRRIAERGGTALEQPEAPMATPAAPAESPAAVPSGDIYVKLDAVEQARKETEARAKAEAETRAPSTSISPIISAAKKVAEKLPDSMNGAVGTGAEMLGGALAGRMLRSGLPQEMVYGTPVYKAEQAAKQSTLGAVEPIRTSAEIAQDVLQSAHDRHQYGLGVLQQEHNAASQIHESNLRALENAQQQHAFAQTLGASEAHPVVPTAPATATIKPFGGEGTANYAQKFGATAPEANLVSSMSEMQQKNIPAQTSALEKIKVMEPGFRAVGESPLLLGQEGQQAAAQRAQQQQQTQLQSDMARKQAQDAVARQKAEAQLRLESAQEAARLSQRTQEAARKALIAHATSAPISPAEEGRQREKMSEWQRLQDTLSQKQGAFRKALSTVGTRIAPRFVPVLGAAFAPLEAETAYKDWKAKNYGRAAIHGLGSLGAAAQATGVPVAMGAGDIAQIPSALLSLYDTATE